MRLIGKFGSTSSLLAILLAAPLAHAQSSAPATVKPAPPAETAQPAPDLQLDPSIRSGTLPNGMRYMIRRNATPPGEASLRLRIDAGSLHETPQQLGLAHFVEHMFFNGTTNVPEGEFIRRLERAGLEFGPDTNAFTDFTQTVYMLDLPETDAATIDTALFLLREGADNALMETSAIDAERPIILAEERTRATPQFRTLEDELAFLYPGQLLPTRMPIGSTEIIRTATRDEFVRFYNAFYRPEKATLIAVGDFDPAAMEAKIRGAFGSWRGEGPAGTQPNEGRPAERGSDADVFVDPAVPTRASLAWVRPANLSPDTRARRAQDLVEGIGLGILNQRLERIAATGSPPPFIAASAVEAQLADTADATQVVALAQPGQWQGALAAAEQEQRRLVQFGITQAELDREIANRRTALTQGAAGADTRPSSAIANGIVASINEDRTVIGPQAALALFEEQVKGLTVEQVNAALPALFSGSGPLLYLTSPTPVDNGRQALLAAFEGSTRVAVTAPAAQQAAAWPYTSFGTPGRVAERREFAEVGATGVRFANGVRLTVKPTTFRDDEVQVSVRVGDGLLDLTSPQAPLASMLQFGAFQLGGLGRISADALTEALAGKTVAATFAIDEDAFTLSGATRPADFATQMQLLAAYVSDPGWQATGYDRLKGFYPQLLAQIEAVPAGIGGSPGVWERDGSALLRGGDRRWTLPSADKVAASTMADARALVAPAFASDPIEVVIVGDITVDEAIAQTAATFGALPPRSGTPAKATPLPFPAGTKTPVRLTHKGRADQGFAFIGWPTQGFHEDMAQSRALGVLAAVFQLRLTDRIREADGISYSPNGSHNASDVFNHGYLSGQVQAPPDKLDRFLVEAQAIAADLRTRPVTADELQRALQPVKERVQRDRTSNGFWLASLAELQTDPRVLKSVTSQLTDYEAVTPAMLQRLAQRTMVPGKAYQVVIVPEAR